MSIERKIFSGFLFIFTFVFLLTAWAYYSHFEKNLSYEQQSQANITNQVLLRGLENTLLDNQMVLKNLNSDGDLALAYDETPWLAQIGIAKLKRKFDRIFENYPHIKSARFYKNDKLMATMKNSNSAKKSAFLVENIELDIANSTLSIEIDINFLLQEQMKLKQTNQSTRVYIQALEDEWLIDRYEIINYDKLTDEPKQNIDGEQIVVSKCLYLDTICMRTLLSFAHYEESLSELMVRIGLLYVIVAFITLLLAKKLSRYIIKPLIQLQNATNRYIRGDYSPIKIEQKDEIADVIEAFNAMGNRIKNFTTELQEEVRARTQELEQANKKLELLATTDALTGLYNRVKIDEIIRYEREKQKRFGNPFCIALIDLDDFKSINDTHGHLEGDKVLQEVAKCLQECIRKTDAVGRWGGEEFLIVLPQTDFEGAMRLAEDINSILKKHPFDPEGVVSASIGVSQYRPGEGLSSFFARTDKYLYRAKKAGKARVVGEA